MLAAACATAASGLIDTDIVQISRVFHTGADPMERMATRSDFEGIVIPDALTANEANYLIGFRTADEIRNRLTKAREETNRRLRSKGIEG